MKKKIEYMFPSNNQKSEVIKYENCIAEYGFTNSQNVGNNALFINITSWVTLLSDSNQLRDLEKLRKEIKIHLYETLENNIFSNYLVTFDNRETGIKQGIRCYLDIEITLFSKGKCFKQCPGFKLFMDEYVTRLVKKIIKNNEKFSFSIK